MKFRFYINDVLLFESQGDLLVTDEVLRIGGFDGGFKAVSFSIVDGVAEVRFAWGENKGLNRAEQDFVVAGRPIMAIKSLRERLELPLKQAKDIVDAWKQKNGHVGSDGLWSPLDSLTAPRRGY